MKYCEILRSRFQQFRSLEQSCRTKYEKAARIAGARADSQWSRHEQILSSAQLEWAREGMLEQVSGAAKYYDELIRRTVPVSLNIYPPQAHVSLVSVSDKNTTAFSGSPSECLDLSVLPNDYEVSVTCKNYHSNKWTIRKDQFLRGGAGKRYDFALAPYDGKIFIKSQEPAEVWSGVKVGNTGEWIPLTAEKAVDLEVKAPGYRTEKLTVQLSANERVEKSVNMTLATGALRVAVQAAEREFGPFMPKHGLLIIDDSEPTSIVLPYTTTMLPGVHEITLSVPGFEAPKPNKETIEIDKWTETLFRLHPINGSVVFTTNIKNSKVKIYANDKYLGHAGEEVFLPPFLKHAIRLTASGYRDGHWDVTLPMPGKKHPDLSVELHKVGD